MFNIPLSIYLSIYLSIHFLLKLVLVFPRLGVSRLNPETVALARHPMATGCHCNAPSRFFVFLVFWFFSRLGFSVYTRLASNSDVRLPLPPESWDERRGSPPPS